MSNGAFMRAVMVRAACDGTEGGFCEMSHSSGAVSITWGVRI